MADQTWFFDRLGENLNVPALIVPSRLSVITSIINHVKVHLEAQGVRPIGLERRSTGGYDVVDRTTGFVYGQARLNRSFGDQSFPILPPPVKRRNSPTKKAGTK